MKLTWTQAQKALMHALWSVLISAFLTLIGGIYQYVVGHGLDIGGLMKVIVPLFLGQLSVVWLTIKNNPNLGQAAGDTFKEFEGILSSRDAWISWIVNEINALKGTNAASVRSALHEPISLVVAGQVPMNVSSAVAAPVVSSATMPNVVAPQFALPQTFPQTLGEMPAVSAPQAPQAGQ